MLRLVLTALLAGILLAASGCAVRPASHRIAPDRPARRADTEQPTPAGPQGEADPGRDRTGDRDLGPGAADERLPPGK